MQFHLEGFRTGDPGISENVAADESRPDEVDVLIIGCGPAGLTLAAQLSAFPDISVRIVERKPGPLKVGQADGIACRSMEMFQAFGFADRVKREAYWVNEVSFWRPSPDGTGIHRADRIQDVEDDLSEMPHTILNQARVHDFYLELMRNSPRRLEPDYNLDLVRLEHTDEADYPVRATFEPVGGEGEPTTVRARYVVGCDGARSTVRKHLGYELKGESARQLWGVMDVLAVTDFPDIRLKSAIQSADKGSIMVIPREGGYLVRLYVELAELKGEERAADRNVTPELLIAKAGEILAPYTIEVKEIAWWSAYEIGQRVCDGFDNVAEADRAKTTPNIFIAGDACHTHSPKAGQGMNVSMADTFNLGWKLAAVIRGQAVPHLLHTYSGERRAKAKELIDFDRDMARLFSAKPKSAEEVEQFQRYFKKHGRFTAGVETRYEPSIITGAGKNQSLAKGLTVGMRFHSAPVIRLADAKPVQLCHAFPADGRWRLVAFAPGDDQGGPDGDVARLGAWLAEDTSSPLVRHTPAGADPDSVIDFRAVFQQTHRELRFGEMPKLLRPSKGRYGLTDYEKIFTADARNGDIFDMRGIDRERGALVIVRPDQFVADILGLADRVELTTLFGAFMRDQRT